MRWLSPAALALLLLLGSPAVALTVTYSLDMTGAKEFPGPGDADGTATGSITLDDVTGAVSWNITYANIAAPNAMHIHPGSVGQAGAPLIDLGVATSGGAGTLISSTTAAPATVASILANPTAFYINIHNVDFVPGAVRDQLGTVLPEPATLVLLGGALAGLGLQRRIRR